MGAIPVKTRIAITGAPRAGKTTLARRMARELNAAIISTDDFKDLGWSEASDRVAGIIARGEFDVLEGVAVPRALRKALATSDAKPVDKLIVVEPSQRWHARHSPQTDGQRAMGKGVRTVLAEILPELRKRGVAIEWRSDPGEES